MLGRLGSWVGAAMDRTAGGCVWETRQDPDSPITDSNSLKVPVALCSYSRDSKSSLKSQMVNILGFVVCAVFVATTQLSCSAKASVSNP